jgi:hypothetical protein
MEGNITIYRLLTGRGTDQWKLHYPSRQCVYSDSALHISNYCVYCIEDQNLTHTIEMHRHFKAGSLKVSLCVITFVIT